MSRKRVVIFDFDGTLTKEDTFISFARHTLGTCVLVWGILCTSRSLIRWKMGLVSGSIAKEKLYSALYRGKNKAEICAHASGFRPRMRKGVLDKLMSHKKSGDTVYIVSASLDLWMREIAGRLGVGLLCTETSVDSTGRLDGSFSTPNCYGEEKLSRLLNAEGDRGSFTLIVYGDEPDGGDAALFATADECHVI